MIENKQGESTVVIPDSNLAEAGAALIARPYVKRGAPSPDQAIRVILVDDHSIVRTALKLMLQRVAHDLVIVGEAANGREAAEMALRLKPDVVVMDLDMPLCGGLEATHEIVCATPAIRVLILTMHEEEERLIDVLRSGAHGYLCKNSAETELVDAIRIVASGDVYVRPAVSRRLASMAAGASEPNEQIEQYHTLSEREQSVLRLTAEGYNGPEIGRQLGIAAKTVDTYKQRIEEKLGFSHRTSYVRFAIQAGLLTA